ATGNGSVDEMVPELAAAIGVKRVSTVVFCGNEDHIVRPAGDAHVRHVERLPHDVAVNTVGEFFPKAGGIDVRWFESSFEGVGSSALIVVLVGVGCSAADGDVDISAQRAATVVPLLHRGGVRTRTQGQESIKSRTVHRIDLVVRCGVNTHRRNALGAGCRSGGDVVYGIGLGCIAAWKTDLHSTSGGGGASVR